MPDTESRVNAPQPTHWTPRIILPPLPGHPVHSALRDASCQRWCDAIELLNTMRRLDPAAPDSAAKVELMAPKLVTLLSEFNSLLEWSLGEREPLTEEKAGEVASMMLKDGYPGPVALDFARRLQRRPRKRPADKRRPAIAALELQLATPHQWTWKDLAKQTYGCQHAARCKCGELLRREVGHVKRFLVRMSIPFPEATPRK